MPFAACKRLKDREDLLQEAQGHYGNPVGFLLLVYGQEARFLPYYHCHESYQFNDESPFACSHSWDFCCKIQAGHKGFKPMHRLQCEAYFSSKQFGSFLT
jgi:hypothetical protein